MSQARSITTAQRFAVYWAWNGRCFWCGHPIRFADVHIDHIIPFSAADRLPDLRKFYALPATFEIDSFENWLPTCPHCNLKKTNNVFDPSPAFIMVLHAVRERMPKAKAIADEKERDHAAAPLLAKLETALAKGAITQRDIEELIAKVPIPTEDVRISDEWEVRQISGRAIVVRLSELYTEDGRRKFRKQHPESKIGFTGDRPKDR